MAQLNESEDAGRLLGGKELRSTTQRLDPVIELQRELAGAKLECSDLIELILRRISELLNADGGCFEMLQGEEVVTEAGTGLGANLVGLRLKTRESLSGHCTARGGILRSDDIERDARANGEARHCFGLRSMLVLPLFGGEGSVAVLKMVSARPAAFGSNAEHLLQLMGEFLGVIVEGQRAQSDLRRSEERFRLAQQVARIGSFQWNIPAGVIQWSPELEALHGFLPGEFPGTFEAWTSLVHKEDLPAVRRCVQEAMETGSFETEWRVARPDGSIGWVAGRGRISKDSAGKPQQMVGVNLDITQRKTAEEQLKAAKTAADMAKALAETANRAKDEFLAILSHELRTPLNLALLAASVLEGVPHLPSDLKENVSIIRRNIELEARLIDDLLDVTRITRGKLSLNRRLIDPCEVLRDAIEICRREALDKRLEFGAHGTDLRLSVFADPARLQQVFWNLLKNAIKFTPAPGRVQVLVTGTELCGIRVEISDTGEGIPPEMLTRIFDSFDQGATSAANRFGGLGLGLAICKGIIDAHCGKIAAFSEGLGRGSTFRVELPPASISASESENPAYPKAAGRQIGCRILLVEDHEMTAKLVGELLESWGHEVDIAGSVGQAVTRFNQNKPDLLISDIGLPDGSGWALLQILKGMAPMKAIALSGFGAEIDLERSRQAGFQVHLIKPVISKQLEEAIAQVMSELA